MKNLSANSLFHFTPSCDNLKSILINGFYHRYCLENLDMVIDKAFEYAYPMVCFCDIPLLQITNHVNFYGKFGVGLSKEWGIKNKINPVFYAYKDSRTTLLLEGINKELTKLFEQSREITFFEIFKKSKAFHHYVDFLMYCKPYKGKIFRNGKYLDTEIRFYDEREWRHIPDIPRVDKPHFFSTQVAIEKFTFLDEKQRKEEEARINLTNYALKFDIDDIKYIIVENESDENELNKFMSNFLDPTIHNTEALTRTKIISIERLQDDF